uniref:Peptidase M28 domain-containing protein n=1 Tax=Alexandrium andersonii TaxID=327968 RepID=A0A7S2J6K6_9DINO|mmetsp:Transcript_95217/g.213248  ORF Transcript_95217/g.213248 Transcript_95217/m.213248 type:complete len:465 (+) Transcript_95217:112-1506(+)
MWHLALLTLLPSLCGAAATTLASLPGFPASGGAASTAALLQEGKWWVHLGDHVYHTPASSSGLSRHVGDYYYAIGSSAALSDELRSRRVGGQGRLHIFHLPDGAAMLQVHGTIGSRRSSLSGLKQLTEGMQLSLFPLYKKDKSYKNPLHKSGQAVEKHAVSRITGKGIMSFLQNLTSFNTRSYQSSQASSRVQDYLSKTFASMGYKVCKHTFGQGGPATNIVAYVPGSISGSEMVIVGAHYDDIPAVGTAPGAEDNGSGVASLMAIMRAFKDTDIRPKKSVAFVAFAGEEPGLLGSDAYAASCLQTRSGMEECLPALDGGLNSSAASFLGKTKRTGRQTTAYQAIIMDEVGWESPALARPTVNLEAYDWTEEVMEHLAQSSEEHNGESLVVVHSNNPFGSDHMSFLNRRIPAVLTINGDDEAYPCYHQSCDKIELVSGELVSKIAKMNMGALLRLAGLEAGATA